MPGERRRTPPAPDPRHSRDTIVAVATPIGESAIGVIRLSGPGALVVVEPLLRASTPLSAIPSHALRRVRIVDPRSGEILDDALCAVMRAPHSYTGEDVVELSCHGSPALLRVVVDRLRARGARLAEPGEFTRRAFLNGRLDLARAETVALLISARTERAVKLAARGVTGGLSDELEKLRQALLDLVAGLEVTLDFPEDSVGLPIATAAADVARLEANVARWLTKARQGRVVHDGITVALVGAPNAGKSSLLNALLGQDRAIVSPTPGTTRDVVEGTIAVGGVPVRLLDTAGLGEPADALEAEGMRRSLKALDEADLLIVVIDASRPPDARVLAETAHRDRVLVRAKSDLPMHGGTAALSDALSVSSLTGVGVDGLVARLTAEVTRRTSADGDEGGLVATLRQIELLEELYGSLESARLAFPTTPLEAVLVDLHRALRSAAALLGIDVGDGVLDRVFSMFCLGK